MLEHEGLYYTLVGTEPRPATQPEFAAWFHTSWPAREVARTQVTPHIEVSTVFLGINQVYQAVPPVLWITKVFVMHPQAPTEEAWMQWYTSHADAVHGHEAAVQYVMAALQESERREDACGSS